MIPDFIFDKLNAWIDNYNLDPSCTAIKSIKPCKHDVRITKVIFVTYKSSGDKLLGINPKEVDFTFPKITGTKLSFTTSYSSVEEFMEIALDKINEIISERGFVFKLRLGDIDIERSKFSLDKTTIFINKECLFYYAKIEITNENNMSI